MPEDEVLQSGGCLIGNKLNYEILGLLINYSCNLKLALTSITTVWH